MGKATMCSLPCAHSWRWLFSRASLSTGFLLVAFAVAGDADDGSRKVRVNDRELARQLEWTGGQLLFDYGGFCVFRVDQATADALQSQPQFEVCDDYDKIQLNARVLDTTTVEVKAARKPVGLFAGKHLHLVQFAGPVQPRWLDTLKRCGVDVVTYIPNNAYLVYGNAGSLARVQSWAGASKTVQWDGQYRDDFKIHPKARVAQNAAAPELYAIQLVADDAANRVTLRVIDTLKTGPIRQQYAILNYVNVIVPLPAAAVATVAGQPDVISIQPFHTPQRFCERQDQIVAGNVTSDQPNGPGYLAWLTGLGFTQAQFSNSAFAVDLSDSGIDDGTTSPNHFALFTLGKTKQPGRVIYNRLVGTPNGSSTIKGCDGHGTINAHIIAGYVDTNVFPHVDLDGYHYGLGVAPYVKIGSSVIFDPVDFTYPNYADLQSMAYSNGVRISNNSWGDPTNALYSVVSQAYDALVRDAQPTGSARPAAGNQEMVLVFAAGNDGNGGDSDAHTILAPATGKNVIAVGGSENVQMYSNDGSSFDGCLIYDEDADSAGDIAYFSSRGPCGDGRMKPDVVAPSTHVSGGVIQVTTPGANGTADSCFGLFGTYPLQVCGGDIFGDDFPFYPDGQQFYTASSGTSHAAPAVAGAAALIRQHFINHSFSPASPAMTKAVLINSARYLTGTGAADDLWSPNQGMGAVDLGPVFDNVARVLRDELASDKFTATGQSHSYSGRVSDGSKPFRVTVAWTDAPGSTVGNAWNNDLDLTVTVGGQTYKGNVFSGPDSTTGGSADPRNNVESVFVPAGVTGNFTVTITAANINSDGVPGDANPLDQDFALVIYNANGGISPDSATLSSESCAPTNGVIDTGETVTMQLGLRNLGSVNTTNLVATLQAAGGVTSPSAAQNYGVLVAGGATVSRSYTFTANGTCAGTITATLQLQDGAANLGTVAFTFRLGAPASTPVIYSYAGAPVAIPDNDPNGVNVAVVVSGFTSDVTALEFSIDGTSCTGTANGINHTYVGDLALTLTSPQGTTVTLMNRPGPGNQGSSGQNFCHTLLSDSVTNRIEDITNAGAPYSGTFAPDEPLATFVGENPNGTWVLNVSDNSADDTGDVRAFSLRIYGRVCCGGAAGDSDGDGLPDSWEMQYFGNLNQTATDDFDGDGQNNLAEYLAGTVPTNSASAFRITAVARESNNLRVTWQTGVGKTNALQRTAGTGGSYSTNNFTNIFIVTNTSGAVTNYLDAGAATNSPARYYRVRLVP